MHTDRQTGKKLKIYIFIFYYIFFLASLSISVKNTKCTNKTFLLFYYTGGSVRAPFTGTACGIQYFKPILLYNTKEMNQDTSIVQTQDFFFISRCLSIPAFRVTHLRIDTNNVNICYYKNTTKIFRTLNFAANTYDSISE